jgi:rhamnulokinase
MNKYLAFDIGASSGRGIIGTLDNGKISLKEVNRFKNTMTLMRGSYYWDFYRIFENIKEGIIKTARLKENPCSLGVDTWGVDYGLLDEKGDIIGVPYAYRDHRTDTAMEEVFKLMPKEELYEKTGIQFMQFNSLFQLHAAIRDGYPGMEIAKSLLFMPDLINYYLSGIKSAELTITSTSQMYNPNLKNWDLDVLKAVGINPALLQDIIQPGTVLGKLNHALCKETSIQELDITAVAGHDTGSAIVAIPATDNNFAYISSGTWSLMGIESDTPLISEETLKLNLTNEGGVAGTFRILKNIMGLWLIQECQRIWQCAGNKLTYPELVKLAENADAFRTIINSDDSSLLNPVNMPKAITKLAETSGEVVPETVGQFARCIFESLALRYKYTVEVLKRISGKKIDKIHIIGGGSQNELLCQFTANATGLPVIAGPVEGTALGNILVQAKAQGHVSSLGEIRSIIRNSFEFKEFIPQNSGAWDEAYKRFLSISIF